MLKEKKINTEKKIYKRGREIAGPRKLVNENDMQSYLRITNTYICKFHICSIQKNAELDKHRTVSKKVNPVLENQPERAYRKGLQGQGKYSWNRSKGN